MPGLHLQRNRRKSAIQKIYGGRGNFNDGCVASGATVVKVGLHMQRNRRKSLKSGSTSNATVVNL